MKTTYLRGVLVRDLRCLRRQVEAYESDADLWRLPSGISNSGGNLALHLAGNLQAFVGAVLGESGYVRDRDAEFSSRDLTRAQVVAQVEAALAAVDKTLAGLGEEGLEAEYPLVLGGVRVKTGDFLLHLCTHLTYHLGQIDYHRRLICGRNDTVGALAISGLASAEAIDSN